GGGGGRGGGGGGAGGGAGGPDGGARRGGSAASEAVPGLGPRRRCERRSRPARLRSPAMRAPAAVAPRMTTATEAWNCQGQKRTVTTSGFSRTNRATARRSRVRRMKRTCMRPTRYVRSRSFAPDGPLPTSSSVPEGKVAFTSPSTGTSSAIHTVPSRRHGARTAATWPAGTVTDSGVPLRSACRKGRTLSSGVGATPFGVRITLRTALPEARSTTTWVIDRGGPSRAELVTICRVYVLASPRTMPYVMNSGDG